MLVVGFDTETERFGPANMAPPLVCYSTSIPRLALRRWDDKAELFELMIDCALGKIKIVGHNIAYDMCVLMAQYWELAPIIFEAYSQGNIEDTMIREMLLALEDTGYCRKISLDDLARKYRQKQLDKGEDSWRLRYGELRYEPIAQWPERAKAYAIEDGVVPKEVYYAQERAARHSDTFAPSPRRARHAFAVQLMTVWGINTDADHVEKVIHEFRASQEALIDYFRSEYVDVDVLNKKTGEWEVKREAVMREKKESFNTKALAARLEELAGEPLPKSPKSGKPRLAKEVLEPLGVGLAEAYLEYKGDGKMISSYLSKYRTGLVQCSANPLLTNGRMSLEKPPMQQVPRSGGIRECFVPRPGKLFASVDFGGIELRTLAQNCLDNLGYSTLAQIYQQDPEADVPTMFSAHILGVSELEAFRLKDIGDPRQDKARSDGKIGLYGLPGGMGNPVFQSNQKRKGNHFTLEEIEGLRRAWHAFLPEMRAHFRRIDAMFPYRGAKVTWQDPRSQHRRANMNYTTLANAQFSTPMAYGSNDAMFEVAKKQYTDPHNVLYGSRTVICVHDELDVEVDEEGAHDQAMEIEKIMCEEMRKMTPDVPIAAESALMRRWTKGAKPVYDQHGRLIPWEAV